MTVPAPTARDLVADVRGRRTSASELAEQTLRAIDASNPTLNAFLAVDYEGALKRAADADRALAKGQWWGPLHGIPVAVKDLHETQHLATSYGARALRDNLPQDDAVIVDRLRRAGAVIVAKTNTPAFGALGETKNRLGPDSRNPWNAELTPGGSSGGSAAALAAGIVPLATASDSAGSISCPASFCGVTGLKPTRGLVPHWPAGDGSLLLEHSGPMARNTSDVELMLDAIAGPDPRDPLSQLAPRLGAEGERSGEGLRLAYSADLDHFAVDAEVRDITAAAANALADVGANVEDAGPRIEDPLGVYMPIYSADFRRWQRNADPVVLDELFEETVDEIATWPLSDEDFTGVLGRLRRLEAELDRFFERFEYLLTPATACAAFKVRQPPSRLGDRDVQPGWQSFMPFQVPWNLAGYPTVTVSAGVTRDGRPVGLLMVGRYGADRALLGLARSFEQVRPAADAPTADFQPSAGRAPEVAHG